MKREKSPWPAQRILREEKQKSREISMPKQDLRQLLNKQARQSSKREISKSIERENPKSSKRGPHKSSKRGNYKTSERGNYKSREHKYHQFIQHKEFDFRKTNTSKVSLARVWKVCVQSVSSCGMYLYFISYICVCVKCSSCPHFVYLQI
jgi:hypothetical protein